MDVEDDVDEGEAVFNEAVFGGLNADARQPKGYQTYRNFAAPTNFMLF